MAHRPQAPAVDREHRAAARILAAPRCRPPALPRFPLPFAALLSLALLEIGSTRRTRRAAGLDRMRRAVRHCSSRSTSRRAIAYRSFPASPIMARARRGHRLIRPWPVRAVVLAAAIVSLIWFPLAERGLAAEQDAASVRDLATALRETGRLTRRSRAYRRSLALDPAARRTTHLDLAQGALSRRRRTRRAEAEAREAAPPGPERREAHFDLGAHRCSSRGGSKRPPSSFAEAWRLGAGGRAPRATIWRGPYLKLGRIDGARDHDPDDAGTAASRSIPPPARFGTASESGLSASRISATSSPTRAWASTRRGSDVRRRDDPRVADERSGLLGGSTSKTSSAAARDLSGFERREAARPRRPRRRARSSR